MAKFLYVYTLSIFVCCTWCNGQGNFNLLSGNPRFETREVLAANAPKSISRTIKQDRKGNIWIAAFDGIFKYSPLGTGQPPLRVGQVNESFTNVMSKLSNTRFFSVLEDRKGHFWFTSIGSGVYRYNPAVGYEAGGKAFENFTAKDGLANDRVPYVYEDKKGNIWFGTETGASRYDPAGVGGKVFLNYLMNGDVSNKPNNDNDVNWIIEDKTGKFWFGTRGKAYTYNGKEFSVFMNEGRPFMNTRTIIEDRKGNIWFGGNEGLWRYDPAEALKKGGKPFTNFTLNFVGYIYEDKNGNIWTSSQRAIDKKWVVSRYDAKSLSNPKPTVMEIDSEYEANAGMVFGILEANDGSIWYGALDGVRRFSGKMITHFKNKE